MILEDEINVKQADLPCTIRSFVVLRDGTYTVILNARLSAENRLKAYQHELWHINNGDYDRKCPVDIIEINAHAHDSSLDVPKCV